MTKNLTIKEALIAQGLKLTDDHQSGSEFDANHEFDELHSSFMQCGWQLDFNGSVGNGIRQAAYSQSQFGGGRAVLYFRNEKVYYLTLNYSRNFHD